MPLKLTLKEFDLLWFLASHPRRVFSRDQLMESVWGYTAALDTGTVTVHVRRLREKIEDDPSRPAHLETVWGAGYRFVAVTGRPSPPRSRSRRSAAGLVAALLACAGCPSLRLAWRAGALRGGVPLGAVILGAA